MASFVKIYAKMYEISQTVFIDYVQTLIDDKGERKIDFQSKQDPHPVDFILEIKFGADFKDYISVYIKKWSIRLLRIEKLSLSIFSGNVELRKLEKGARFFPECSVLGAPKFCNISKLENKCDSISIKCKITYEGEIQVKRLEDELGENALISRRMLSVDLQRMFKNGSDTDVSFVVDDQTIKAHKLILSARSDYFKNMFDSGMIEANSDQIVIRECSADIFKEVIRFLYTNNPPTDIKKIAFELLPLADQYLLTSLKNHCENALCLNASLNKENVREYLLLAHRHNCPTLKHQCIHDLQLSTFADWIELKYHSDLLDECLQYDSKIYHIPAEIYETSQTVFIYCLQSLVKNEVRKETYPFPNATPWNFRLSIRFGTGDNKSLQIYIIHSVRDSNVRINKGSMKLFKNNHVLLKEEVFQNCLIPVGQGLQLVNLEKLNELQCKNIYVRCKIQYKREIGQNGAVLRVNDSSNSDSQKSLSDDLWNILTNESETDIYFFFEDEVIGAHQLILSARSDYFKSLFQSIDNQDMEIKECSSKMFEKVIPSINIKDCSSKMFKKVLQFLYTDIPPEDIHEIAFELLPLADRYLLPSLKNHCERKLIMSLDQENIHEYLLVSHKYNCPFLKKQCFEEILASKFTNCVELKNQNDLKYEYLQFISKQK